MKFVADIINGVSKKLRDRAEAEKAKRKMHSIGMVQFQTTIVDDDGKPTGSKSYHVALLRMNALGERHASITSNHDYMAKKHSHYPYIMAWEAGGPLPPDYKPLKADQAIRDMLIALVDKEFDMEGE